MRDERDRELARLRRALALASTARWDAEAALIKAARTERLAREALRRAEAEIGAGRGADGEGGPERA